MSTEAQRLRSRKAWQVRHYGNDDARTVQTTRKLAAAKLAAGRRRRIRGALAAVAGCAAAGSAGYALSSPVVAAAGLMAAAVVAAIVGAAVVVMLSAMLGGRDPRSPFERLILVMCVITGRRPGDHLPPVSGCRGSRRGTAEDH